MAGKVKFQFIQPALGLEVVEKKDEKKHHEFECCECGEPGCFGEGVSLLKGIVGTWYCRKHVPKSYFVIGDEDVEA